MSEYRFKADLVFEAKSPEDALNKISDYFLSKSIEEKPEHLFVGTCEIKEVK